MTATTSPSATNRDQRLFSRIAKDIAATPRQVQAAADLLDGGATVPFVARYRKEATGGLDDAQLRLLNDRLSYLRGLEDRRTTVLNEIARQDKLTPELENAIRAADSKSDLEDLYLPYKPKRRTRAMIARERGLEPLLDAILSQRNVAPETLAGGYLRDDVADAKAALAGARDILVERLAENARILGRLRGLMRDTALLRSTVVAGKEAEGAKFSDYFAHEELWARAPGHRVLAMLRAADEGVVTLDIAPPETTVPQIEGVIASPLTPLGTGLGDDWLRQAVRWTWRVKLSTSMMLDLLAQMRTRAHDEARQVFARNLKDLLLAAPAGPKATLGLDPGIRTGVKAAVVDRTGKVVETATLYPFQPRNQRDAAAHEICQLVARHGVDIIAVGNGTASRETEQLATEALRHVPKGTATPRCVVVSEAGASVYSASELASRELPDLDVSLRGAVSIARRLQDPLAELVKIDPRSIGVGQYQHDVDQTRLSQALDAVVEDAVNAVGVDLNTASPALLARVSGLGPALAESVVNHRDTHGAFASRKGLLKVARLGPRAFEQCAGFLRIRGGSEPLDASAVHPEAYDLARRIVSACGRPLDQVMGDGALLARQTPDQFVTEKFGLPTVRDILAELEKPGRDPRPEFKTAQFAEGVNDITDLKPGMSLEGTVTNVAAFGAFVDIGVHQDGLVHISQLADRFVKDPHEIVKTGDVVRVRVTEVDVARKRIGLSMRKDGGSASQRAPKADAPRTSKGGHPARRPTRNTPSSGASDGAMGAALRNAFRKK